jgi:hypothetical protein
VLCAWQGVGGGAWLGCWRTVAGGDGSGAWWLCPGLQLDDAEADELFDDSDDDDDDDEDLEGLEAAIAGTAL